MLQEPRITCYPAKLLPPFRLLNFVDYPAGHQGAFHAHDSYQDVLVLQGCFAFEFPGRETMCIRTGQLGVVPPMCVHGWRALSRTTCKTMMLTHAPLTGQIHGELSAIFGGSSSAPLLAGLTPGHTKKLAASLRRECVLARPASPGLVQGLLIQLLALASRHFLEEQPGACGETREGRAVRLALNYMENHYREPLTLKEIAAQAFLGTSRFSEIFRRHTGLAPMHYLQRLRGEKAENLLQYTDLEISQIADLLGFASIHYFSRFFRKYAKKSPTAFRREHAES